MSIIAIIWLTRKNYIYSVVDLKNIKNVFVKQIISQNKDVLTGD